MMQPFRTAGAQLAEAELMTKLKPGPASAAEYRSQLEAFAAVITGELAALPEPPPEPATPEPLVEKAAGFASQSLHG